MLKNDNNENIKSDNGESEKEEIDKNTNDFEAETKEKKSSGDNTQSEDTVKQLDFYKDQLLRRVAEFENYKKRTEGEMENIVKFANEYLVSDILPVIDDFERCLESGKEKNEKDSFYVGIGLIYSKLMKILETKGLKQIEALNKTFDVNFHEAMLTMQKNDVEPNIVIQEILKGYMLNDKVIRHSKVAVSAESNKDNS
jgi:molecular chaperone GrpE